jgi:hypothetical protein
MKSELKSGHPDLNHLTVSLKMSLEWDGRHSGSGVKTPLASNHSLAESPRRDA